MNAFFIDDCSIDEISASYVGKTMSEIMKLEKERFDSMKDEIDSKHNDFIKEGRSNMLTVQRLIDYLKTQDPNACILAYEPNSDAYIEQFPSLPSPDVLDVTMAKKQMRDDLRCWYKDTEDAEQKIERDVSTVFRYANDNDVIIRFN